jgi:hypothetical protein
MSTVLDEVLAMDTVYLLSASGLSGRRLDQVEMHQALQRVLHTTGLQLLDPARDHDAVGTSVTLKIGDYDATVMGCMTGYMSDWLARMVVVLDHPVDFLTAEPSALLVGVELNRETLKWGLGPCLVSFGEVDGTRDYMYELPEHLMFLAVFGEK